MMGWGLALASKPNRLIRLAGRLRMARLRCRLGKERVRGITDITFRARDSLCQILVIYGMSYLLRAPRGARNKYDIPYITSIWQRLSRARNVMSVMPRTPFLPEATPEARHPSSGPPTV